MAHRPGSGCRPLRCMGCDFFPIFSFLWTWSSSPLPTGIIVYLPNSIQGCDKLSSLVPLCPYCQSPDILFWCPPCLPPRNSVGESRLTHTTHEILALMPVIGWGLGTCHNSGQRHEGSQKLLGKFSFLSGKETHQLTCLFLLCVLCCFVCDTWHRMSSTVSSTVAGIV